MSGRSRWASRSGAVVAFACLALALLTACTTVEPWEREQQATPRMQSEPHAPHAGFVDHVRSSREAAAAGSRADGAGCGCY